MTAEEGPGPIELEEFSRLNNELVNAQRELAQKNAELRRLKEQLEYETIHDPLTGAFNRRFYMQRLAEETSKARRAARPLALAFSDLDYFKNVNDRHGHAAGDAALVAFARVLAEVLRPYDVIARLGGDEFCVLFPETAAPDACRALERVRERLAATQICSGEHRFFVTGTFGVAEFDRLMSDEAFTERADQALYRAKADGRNCVREAPEASAPPAPRA